MNFRVSEQEKGLEGAREGGEGVGGKDGGGGALLAAVVEKGCALRVPRPPPLEGPRSIQTRSNKAFPLSSLQNTKQNREREREREGEREKERERGEKLFR